MGFVQLIFSEGHTSALGPRLESQKLYVAGCGGGAENAGLENAASDCRGGKRGTGKCRSLKSIESEDFKNVFLTVLTERIVRLFQ